MVTIRDYLEHGSLLGSLFSRVTFRESLEQGSLVESL